VRLVDQTEDQESPEISLTATPAEQPKRRRSWLGARHDLTEQELASPAAVKLLLDEVDRLDLENGELAVYRERFHETDKACAVLTEQQKGNLAADIVSTAAISLGGVLLRLLPSMQDRAFWELLGVGVLIAAAGIAAKIVRR
jgi:hypothetical protein